MKKGTNKKITVMLIILGIYTMFSTSINISFVKDKCYSCVGIASPVTFFPILILGIIIILITIFFFQEEIINKIIIVVITILMMITPIAAITNIVKNSGNRELGTFILIENNQKNN